MLNKRSQPPVIIATSPVSLLETSPVFGFVDVILAIDSDSSTLWYEIVGEYVVVHCG